MIARWTAAAVMVLDKGKQTSLGLKQKKMAVKHDASPFLGYDDT